MRTFHHVANHPDHLNTPRLVANDQQQTVWKWEQQEPFGASAANDDPDENSVPFEFNLRFPGQYFDREISGHYNYFRSYEPALGRYVEGDAIGLIGGLNQYSYVLGDPISMFDFYGLANGGAAQGGYVRSQSAAPGAAGVGVNITAGVGAANVAVGIASIAAGVGSLTGGPSGLLGPLAIPAGVSRVETGISQIAESLNGSNGATSLIGLLPGGRSIDSATEIENVSSNIRSKLNTPRARRIIGAMSDGARCIPDRCPPQPIGSCSPWPTVRPW